MRIKVCLKPIRKSFAIPINYNYPLSSAIYRLFFESSPKFSKWLHDQGFVSPEGKKMKLFTFSRLFITNPKVEGTIIEGRGLAWFLFSTPLEFAIMENFVVGILKKGRITIGNGATKSDFTVSSLEILPEPELSENMKYIMLSPTVVSTMVEKDGKVVEHYYRTDEPGLENNLAENLRRKYEIVRKKPYEGKIEIELDREYIERKGGAEGVSKMVTIAEGKLEETKVKGFICPIVIKGSKEIQKVAYDCGIGKKNSMGFGMLEVISRV